MPEKTPDLDETEQSTGQKGRVRDPIVVIGSRISEPASTIESPPAIDSTLPVESLDLLDLVPDIRAVSTAGAGGTSFVSIRGGEPNFAQILLDGVRVSNPSSSQGGGFDFAQFDPALISNITLVPIGRTAVHGSDALSGVIAIEMIVPERSGTQLSGYLVADTAEAVSGGARAGFGWDNGGVILAGSYSDSGELTEGSGSERNQFFFKAQQNIGNWDLSGFLLYGETEREAFPESSGGPRFAVNRALELRDTRFFTAGLSISGNASESIRPALRVGYYDDNVRADTPAIFPGIFAPVPALTSDTDFNRLEITGDVRFRVAPNADLVVGGNFLTETAQSTGTIDFGFLLPTAFAITREQLSGFAEVEWRPVEGLKLSVAGRSDWLRSNAETTVQASLEYSIGENGVTLFGGYAEGFHLPSLFALAFPLTANPNLRPERSNSWEGGIKWETGTTKLRASVFYNDYTDLIDFDPVLFTTVNRSAVNIRGVSLSGDGKVGTAVEWNGSITWLDINSPVPLRSRPDWYGNAMLAWRPFAPLRIGATVRFNSEFAETSIPTGVIELGGHVTADLFAEWQASKDFILSLTLRNATGADYEDAVGFPAPGRVLRFRAGFSF